MDTAQPRLSWIGLQKERGAIQSGYEVQVSTNPQELAKGTQTVFDSGRVQSSSEMVVYAGEALSSNRDYYWRVRLWDGHGRAGAWSKIAHFEMGLQSPADWLDARWIAGRDETEWRARWRAQKAQEHTKYANSYMTPVTTSAHMNSWQLLDSVTPRYDPAPLLRKTFPVDRKIRKAHLYVSGVGYAVTSINGAALDGTTNRAVLDPGWTNYERRVLYRAFDVTNRLKIGRNALGITLGRGFYGMLSNDRWGFSEHAPWIDQPSLKSLLIIEYADGSRDTVASDDSWRTVPGPIVYDDPWPVSYTHLESRQAVLAEAIQRGVVLTSKIANPKTPAYPTTTIRLNRAEAGIPEEAQRFHPVAVHDGSISEAIEEERGNM